MQWWQREVKRLENSSSFISNPLTSHASPSWLLMQLNLQLMHWKLFRTCRWLEWRPINDLMSTFSVRISNLHYLSYINFLKYCSGFKKNLLEGQDADAYKELGMTNATYLCLLLLTWNLLLTVANTTKEFSALSAKIIEAEGTLRASHKYEVAVFSFWPTVSLQAPLALLQILCERFRLTRRASYNWYVPVALRVFIPESIY